jgi:hypothetical protein
MNRKCTMLVRSFVTALFLAVGPANAQTASVTGTVIDNSGGAVPDATVQVTNLGTGATSSAQTNESGVYSFPNLAVGQYDVSVQKDKFQTLNFKNVTLTVAQNLTLNGTLTLGQVSQSTNVSGAVVPAVDLEDAQLSNVIEERRIVDLPLITRDPYSLVLLSPGAQVSTSALGGFSVNGQRERNNNFLLDGVDNNDPAVPGIPGGASSINPDSTQEFRVITNNFLPEFGRNTGAVVDIVTRSGTNDFHGTAYEFNRVNAMAARDYFNPSPDAQNPFTRNQFGFSIGGPIVKNKTFFFDNSEWDRYRTTLVNQAVVPTAAFKTGLFTYNGVDYNLADPASPTNATGLTLSPRMQQVLGVFPNPNGPAVDDIRGIFYFPTSIPQNSGNTTFRLDHRFSDKYSASARYVYNNVNTANSLDEIVPGIGGISSPAQTQNGSFNFLAAFRPNLINQFWFGLNRADVSFTCNGRDRVDALSTPDALGFGTDYSFETSTLVPTISNLGCGALGDSNEQFRRAGTWFYSDHLSYVAGNHTLVFGMEFRYIFENGYDAFSSRPLLDFTAFANSGVTVANCGNACGDNEEVLQTMAAALQGLVGEQSQTQFFNAAGQRNPNDFRRFVQHEYGAFLQDSWKIRPNLTLMYGLRYEFNGVPVERNGNLSNLLYQQPYEPSPIVFQTVGSGTGRDVFFNDPYNFEPRLGLAWDPFRDGKTSVRLGYGIFHDRVFGNLFTNLKGNPPFVANIANFVQSEGPGLTPVDLLAPTSTLPAPSNVANDGDFISATLIQRQLRMPYTQSWNVGIQRQFGSSDVFDVNYVGSGSHRQFRSVDGNPPQPALVAAAHAAGLNPTISGTTLRLGPLGNSDVPQLTGNLALFEPIVTESVGNATYNALQAVYTHRLNRGIQFQAAYTYSHAIDDSADPIVTVFGNRNIARNSFNLHEERGSSDFDLRHRLVLSFMAELPFGFGKPFLNHGLAAKILGGWQVSGLSTMQSGRPFDIFSSRDSEYTGISNRPDLVGSTELPADSPRNQTGPPVTGFDVQPFGRPGNVGRNLFTGPTLFNTDIDLLKRFTITERVNLEFRAECYNVFNHLQFQQPGTTDSGNTLADPGTFGLSLSELTQPDGTTVARQIQLALKLRF